MVKAWFTAVLPRRNRQETSMATSEWTMTGLAMKEGKCSETFSMERHRIRVA
jgi:hypothetical protein